MRTGRIVSSLAAVLVLCVSARAEEPRTITEFAKITASDGIPGDGFGVSLAADGDYLVVGARSYFTQAGPGVGAVYVFRRSGPNWVQVGQLFAEDGGPHDAFGHSVAIEDDLILIGAPQPNGFTFGSAYLFRLTDPGTPDDPSDDRWLQDAKLTSPDEIRTGDTFGSSVAISHGVLLIGRPGWDESSGSAYVYRQVNSVWRYWATLDPSDSVVHDTFGNAVSLKGPVAFVGAWRRDEVGIDSGAVYVFQESQGTWSELQKLVPGDAGDFGLFGQSIALCDGFAVVGAHERVYTYTQKDHLWSEDMNLAPVPRGVDFGRTVSASADSILVGDPSFGPNFSHLGAAHLYTLRGGVWELGARLLASKPIPSTNLGFSVVLGGNYAFAGATESVFAFVLPTARKSLSDFAGFQNCIGTSLQAGLGDCGRFELVFDGQVDSHDLTEFLAVFAGP